MSRNLRWLSTSSGDGVVADDSLGQFHLIDNNRIVIQVGLTVI